MREVEEISGIRFIGTFFIWKKKNVEAREGWLSWGPAQNYTTKREKQGARAMYNCRQE